MDKKHKNHDKKSGEAPWPAEMDCKCDKNNDCVCEEAKPEAPAPAAEKKAPDYYEQLLRLTADFENYRKRVEKEKPEFVKSARPTSF